MKLLRLRRRLTIIQLFTINWKSVKFSLKSFDMDAITKRDIALAREIEEKLKGNK
jgi:pterin-4a-carbinolamine dehydratase